MLAILFYIITMIVSFVWIGQLQTRFITDHNVIYVIWLLVFLVWGGIMVACIRTDLKAHLRNFSKIKELERNMDSKKYSLELYQAEMKQYLLETYPEYEEKLIKGITDSKILATIIEKEGYSKVVIAYDTSIKRVLDSIADINAEQSEAIAEMEAFQNDTWGWSIFLPKRFRYTEI